MKLKTFALTTLVIGSMLLAASPASAHFGGMKGGRGLDEKANILGMTAEDLRTQLQTKSFQQIAKEKGISEDTIHQKMKQAYEQKLKDQGLSADEISKRLKAWDTWQKIHTEASEQRLKSIASAIGKSVDQLKKELESKPLHQILEDQGLLFKSDKGGFKMHGFGWF